MSFATFARLARPYRAVNPYRTLASSFLGARPRYLTTPPDDGSGDKKPPASIDRNDPYYWDFIRSIKNPFISSTIDYFIRSHELAGPKAEKLRFPDWQSTIVFTVPELPGSLKGHETDADGIPLPPNTFIANSPTELRDLVVEIIEHKKGASAGQTEDDADATPAEPERAPAQETVEPEGTRVGAIFDSEGRPLVRRVIRDYPSTSSRESEVPEQTPIAPSHERPDFTALKAQIEKLHDDVEWFLIRSAEIEAVSRHLSNKQKYRARLEFAQAKKLIVRLGKRIEALQEIDEVFKKIRMRSSLPSSPTKTETSKKAQSDLEDDLDEFEEKDRRFLEETMAAEKPAQARNASQATRSDSIWDSGAFKTISDFMKGTSASNDEKKPYSSGSDAVGNAANLGYLEDRMVQRVGEVMSDMLRDMQTTIQEDIEGASEETTKFTERMQSLENLVHQLLKNQEAAKGVTEGVVASQPSKAASDAKDQESPKKPLSYLSDHQKSRLGAEVDTWVKEAVEDCLEELEDLGEDEQFDIVSDLEKSGLVRDMANRTLEKVVESKKLRLMLDELFDSFRDENEDLENIVAKAVEESVKELKDAPAYRKHGKLLKRVMQKARYEQNGWSIDV
ncbi:hypothetical protein TWF696_000938 [Orbilia brochopaga]|uniref:Uncharacterized protein n=1 Tax=Orbilia brochopaga TaxID=3140254 RepID=A0AAV9VF71_9PEZI